MNTTIIGLTTRELLGQKRTLLIGLLALIPIALAIIFRSGGKGTDPQDWVTNTLFINAVVGGVLPFIALIFGTAALGTEFEDGTAVYLLAKPVARWRVAWSKLFTAWLATAAFVTASGIISSLIALRGDGGAGIVTGFVVASLLGAFVYCAIFIAASIFTAHALIAGLIYVFLWEGVLTNLFHGLRVLSVREYTIGLAHALGGISDNLFKANLGGIESFILMVVVGVIATWLAVRWLTRWEINDRA